MLNKLRATIKNDQGFTLIEMLIVMSIIAIIFFMSVFLCSLNIFSSAHQYRRSNGKSVNNIFD